MKNLAILVSTIIKFRGARKPVTIADILLVEDDEDHAYLLCYSLQKCGYSVTIAHTGKDALCQFEKKAPDLVILDVLLPDTTGFELLTGIRHRTSAPVLMMSATMCSEENQWLALLLGAQDYLSKSYSHRELLARVKNLLTRQTDL